MPWSPQKLQKEGIMKKVLSFVKELHPQATDYTEYLRNIVIFGPKERRCSDCTVLKFGADTNFSSCQSSRNWMALLKWQDSSRRTLPATNPSRVTESWGLWNWWTRRTTVYSWASCELNNSRDPITIEVCEWSHWVGGVPNLCASPNYRGEQMLP